MKPTFYQTIDRMKAEILADITRGAIPSDMGSFSELHDDVDANEYGGFCEEGFAGQFGGINSDSFMTHSNDAQKVIDSWLRAGRPAQNDGVELPTAWTEYAAQVQS